MNTRDKIKALQADGAILPYQAELARSLNCSRERIRQLNNDMGLNLPPGPSGAAARKPKEAESTE